MNQKYNEILKRELIESMGCTEPSAIAFAVAYCREQIDEPVESIKLQLSSNVLKNALCVTIPNTSRSGIKMIVALALSVGKSQNKLTILNSIQSQDIKNAEQLIKDIDIDVGLSQTTKSLYIQTCIKTSNHVVEVIVEDEHDKISSCKLDNEIIFENKNEIHNEKCQDVQMNLKEILTFITSAEIDFLLLRNVRDYNLEIASHGTTKSLGLGLGNKISNTPVYNEVISHIIAKTAGGIDARMSGTAKRVYINSGSGNQGITATVPVIEFARLKGLSEEKQLRALALSHLLAIYIRSSQGKLSSTCGAVCAAAGVAGSVAYILGGNEKEISGAVTNLLCSNFGVFCDGAKSTCSLKVVSAVSSAITCAYLAVENIIIDSKLGVISNALDKTLNTLGKIENKFTQELDKVILEEALKDI